METEFVALLLLVLSLVIVFAVDTIQKRRRFLAGQDQ